MQIVFKYKAFRKIVAPIITVGININSIWHPIEVYSDSGAMYTILHSKIAEGLGIMFLVNGSTCR